MRIPPRVAIFAILVALLGGCREPYKSRLPTAPMTLGGKTFVMEIADTSAAREVGLMYRDSMPSDHGMIFVFSSDQTNPFWMKNTRIPLDIVYVDADARVIAVRPMRPYDTTPVPSPRPFRWAIELNQGTGASLGLKEGDLITVPDRARHPQD